MSIRTGLIIFFTALVIEPFLWLIAGVCAMSRDDSAGFWIGIILLFILLTGVIGVLAPLYAIVVTIAKKFRKK